MKHLLILCLIELCSVSQAQELVSPLVPLASRDVPIALKRAYANPKQGQLKRGYAVQTGKNSGETWLLLFERKQSAQEKAANSARNHDDLELGITTLLVVESGGTRGKSGVLRRVVPLGEVSKTSNIAVRWLNSSQRTGPVLVVPRNFSGGFGTTGFELIAFPDGWKQQKAVRQSFKDWMNPIQGASHSFDSVDEKGFLLVIESLTNYGEPVSSAGTKRHHWNGKGWSKEEGKTEP